MTDQPDRWREVRRKIDRLEDRLRRGRLTVPTYLTGALFFLLSGFWTDNWAPAGLLAALCGAAAWLTHRVRRTRIGQLRALEALERSLPSETAPEDREDPEGTNAEGRGVADRDDRG